MPSSPTLRDRDNTHARFFPPPPAPVSTASWWIGLRETFYPQAQKEFPRLRLSRFGRMASTAEMTCWMDD